jgi:hypothetical protein
LVDVLEIEGRIGGVSSKNRFLISKGLLFEISYMK